MTVVSLVCLHCDKTFRRQRARERWRVNHGSVGPFCGRKCSNSHSRGAVAKGVVTLRCAACGSDFERRRGTEDRRINAGQPGPFCSKGCVHRKNYVRSFMEKWEYDNGCWRWTAATDPAGYGRFGYKRKTVLSHHLAYEWYHERPINEGYVLHHICQNPPCCNPIHLTEVTPAEHTKLHRRDATGRFVTTAKSTGETEGEGWHMEPGKSEFFVTPAK